MYNNSNQKIELNLSNLYTYFFLKKNDAYQRSSSDAKRLAAGL